LGPGAIAPIVFERVGFAGRHRSDERVDLGFWQSGELFVGKVDSNPQSLREGGLHRSPLFERL
jgi:hypothetical protein